MPERVLREADGVDGRVRTAVEIHFDWVATESAIKRFESAKCANRTTPSLSWS